MAATSNSRDAALEAARLIADHKGEDTVVLDLSEISSIADYFIITTVRSSAHLAGLHRELSVFLRTQGVRPRNGGHKGRGEVGWLLLDLSLIHI